MHAQESDLIGGDKQYFYDMISAVRKKLDCLPTESLIKKYFPLSRLDEVRGKIETLNASELEWAYWQPLFLFLRTQSSIALNALDEDRMSHDEMVLFEKALSRKPLYLNNR